MKRLLIIIAVVLLAGCSGQKRPRYESPRFETVLQKSFSFISGEVPFYGTLSGLFEYKDNLIVVRRGSDDAFVFLFSLEKKEIVSSCVLLGRAEHELVHCTYCSLDEENGNLFLYDQHMNKMLKVKVDAWIDGESDFISEVEVAAISSHAEDICHIQGGWLVLNGFPKKYQGSDVAPRLEIYDEGGLCLASDDSGLDIGEVERMALYNGGLVVSADGMKWAIASSTGGILETFEFIDGAISRTGHGYFYQSDLETHLNDWAHSSTVLGFRKPCFSDDKVYAPFEFEVTWKDLLGPENKYKTQCYKKIGVFDDHCHPIVAYEVDYEIQIICVSGHTLYALVMDDDGICRFATLPL